MKTQCPHMTAVTSAQQVAFLSSAFSKSKIDHLTVDCFFLSCGNMLTKKNVLNHIQN